MPKKEVVDLMNQFADYHHKMVEKKLYADDPSKVDDKIYLEGMNATAKAIAAITKDKVEDVIDDIYKKYKLGSEYIVKLCPSKLVINRAAYRNSGGDKDE